MKNDPKGLNKILSGILIIPYRSDDVYITADIRDPLEFIFIPDYTDILFCHPKLYTITGHMRKNNIWHEGELIIPGYNDIPRQTWCYVFKNKVFVAEDFTWVGNEVSGCWAYYPKP